MTTFKTINPQTPHLSKTLKTGALLTRHSLVLCAVSCLILLSSCQRQSARSIVARVNQEDILLFDLHTRLKEYQFDAKLNTPEKNLELKKNVLNELIQEKIMLQSSKKLKLQPSPKDIETRALQMHGAQTTHMSNWEKNRIHQRISRQMQARNLFKHVTKDIPKPTEVEMSSHYQAHKDDAFVQQEQIRIKKIIVSKRQEARQIVNELHKGAAFDQVVKKYSVLPESSLAGDTGWVVRGTFESILENVIYDLKEGALSPIIETQKGFYVVKVLKKRSAKTLSFEEVRDFIYENMLQERRETHYNQWLESQILDANIERNHALLQEDIPIP